MAIMRSFPKYYTTHKSVGETPLMATERLRSEREIPEHIPLAYAGRLDPMASGKLLILVGDECKKQTRYHNLDKEYIVEMLLGVSSDSGDVLGDIQQNCPKVICTENEIQRVLQAHEGVITLSYPHFSAKTVSGKPLHVWTLENRLNEIEIPQKESRIYRLTFRSLQTITKEEILAIVRAKIETIPPVTEASKALGADFRRDTVRTAWDRFEKEGTEAYQLLTFRCTASSGTYMRSLCEKLGAALGSCALAYSIDRTEIGRYLPVTRTYGVWITRF